MFHNFIKKQLLKTCLASMSVVTCLTIVTLIQRNSLNQLDITKNIDVYRAEADAELYKLNLLIKSPDFGFGNLISNYAYVRFINYFGDTQAREALGYGLNSKFLETIIAKDPFHTKAQFIISPMVTLKEGNPQKTVSLLEKSLNNLSPIVNSEDKNKLYKPNFLWVYKGIDELLFLGDSQAAQKSYLKAAEWSRILGDTTRAKSTQQMADFLAKDPDSRTVQVGAWFNIWTSAPDMETRNLAQRNIERLGGRLEIHENGRATAYPPQEDKS